MLKFSNTLKQTDNSIIKIKNVRAVYGIDSLQKYFEKELAQIALDDIIEENTSIEGLLQKIKDMHPNTLLLSQGGQTKAYLLVETDVILGEYILMRKNRLLCSGDEGAVKLACITKIQKEFPSKFDNVEPLEVDDKWLSNFCLMHYNNSSFFRLIKIG